MIWVANGYLQSAEYLAEKMHGDDAPNDMYHRRIPLYLCHHAVELSYKAALTEEGLTYPNTHDLVKLRSECVARIADADFEVPEWLIDNKPHTANLFPEFPVIHFDNLHQRARYISDPKGRPMQPLPDLDLAQVIDDLFRLKKSWFPLFNRLSWR